MSDVFSLYASELNQLILDQSFLAKKTIDKVLSPLTLFPIFVYPPIIKDHPILEDHLIIEDLSTENILKCTKILRFFHSTKHFFLRPVCT